MCTYSGVLTKGIIAGKINSRALGKKWIKDLTHV
jgi:hypothetical protein